MRSCYDAIMRTTLDLTPEAYHQAKSVARERKKSMGAVVSEYIVGPTTESRPEHIILGTSKAGFPTFSSGRRITSEDVKAMIDEMDEEDER